MSSTAHFPDADSFHRQSDEFMAWLVQNPGVRVNSKIRIADLRSRDAGRGVVAQTDIPEGEELFAIPRGLVLSTSNSKLKTLLSLDLEELGPWFSLILVMMYEYLLGDKSTWASYFKILPRRFDTLMFWSESELRELQGSAVIEKIGKQSAEESILEMIAPVVRGNPSLFPPVDGLPSYDGDAGTQALLNIVHTMASLVMAYAFDIEKPEDEDDNEGEDGYVTDEEDQLSKGMVPLADLLNADADRNNARLFQEEDFLVMKAIKPINQGHEIFNDYGEIPRSDLLRRYGYVSDNYAPYDVIELSLDSVCQAAGLANANIESQPQLQFLEDLELLDDGYTIPRPVSEDSLSDILPDELIALVKTLTLSPQQLQHQVSKRKPPKPSFGVPEATILQKAVRMKCALYATTIPQDQELLAKLNASGPLDTSSRRQKMAVQVRLGEKEILLTLSTMLDSLAARQGGSAAKRDAHDAHDPRKAKVQKV